MFVYIVWQNNLKGYVYFGKKNDKNIKKDLTSWGEYGKMFVIKKRFFFFAYYLKEPFDILVAESG